MSSLMAYTINIPKSSVFISKGEYESLFAGLSLKILGFTDFPLISGSLLKPLLYYLNWKVSLGLFSRYVSCKGHREKNFQLLQ